MSDVVAPGFAVRAETARVPFDAEVIGIAACMIAPLAMGVLAVVLGQDANWDLRNYHWYNAHAALHGRLDIDLAPAHTPTYFNPLLDIAFYGLAALLPAKAVSFVLGFVQGLNFIPLYLIASLLVPWQTLVGRSLAAAAIGAVGLLGGGHLGLIGTTFFDNVVSIPILFGLWLALRTLQSGETQRPHWVLSGALIGFGVGLKLPAATYGLGFCVALLLAGGSVRDRLARTLRGGLGALGGLVASAGWWMAHLYISTGNPLFPFFNHVFRSPQALAEGYRDTQFVPGSLVDAVVFPFLMALNPRVAGEVNFTDYRVATLAVVAIATAGAFAALRSRLFVPAQPASVRFAATFVAVSYVTWLGMFAIYRYLITIEMLAPILIAAFILRWPLAAAARTTLAAVILSGLFITARPGEWGRAPWAPDFVDVGLPYDVSADAMVLTAGYTPTAWVASAFPDTTPLIRLHGFSFGPEDGDAGWAGEARRRVAAHRGPFYLLIDKNERAAAELVLAQHTLATTADDCKPVTSNLSGDIRLCPVHRMKDTHR